ncbi:MAG: cytochrome c biogenesis protein CcdA [Cyanobacteria bacterium P01_H01_bin.15]
MTIPSPRRPQVSERKAPAVPTKIKRWWFYGVLAVLGFAIAIAIGPALVAGIERGISIIENQYQQWFDQQDVSNPFLLLSLSFFGGLLASVSPCILALLPVNLSYIGTLNIKSRRDAFFKAGLFVLGTVTILSLFGLASSFAGAVMVEYRGYVNIVVGIIMIVMGLSLLGLIKLPLPQWPVAVNQAGPFGVGVTFALVSSPCASPVLFAVLAAAAATGSQVMGTLTMVSYALGYTIIIFLSSLFTALVKQTKTLLAHSENVIRFGTLALILTGTYFLWTGFNWFVG